MLAPFKTRDVVAVHVAVQHQKRLEKLSMTIIRISPAGAILPLRSSAQDELELQPAAGGVDLPATAVMREACSARRNLLRNARTCEHQHADFTNGIDRNLAEVQQDIGATNDAANVDLRARRLSSVGQARQITRVLELLRPTRRIALRWLAPVAAIWPLAAVGAATPAAMLVTRMRQALGGDAWQKISAIEIDYDFQRGQTHAKVKRIEDVAAGRYVTTWTLPARTVSAGFDGINAWDQNSGVYYAYGDEDARRGAENESFRVTRALIFPDRHAATISIDTPVQEGVRQFDRLSISPDGGRPFELLLDSATHLPARIIEQSAEHVDQTDLSDYRQIDGVMVPQTISSDGDTMHALRIRINPIVDDRAFDKPAETRPLHWPANPISIPFQLEGSTILVELMINGKGPFDAEVDSGGGFIVSPSALVTIGAPSEGTSRARGGGEGFTISKTGTLSSVAIGGADLGTLRYATLEIGRGHSNRVLIGEPLLQRAVVKFDFDAMQMTIAPFNSFDYQGSGAAVPFHFEDNQPEVLGKIDGIAARMTIDTGDSGSLLLIAPFARRYRLAERYHATVPYHGTAVTSTYGLLARAGTVQLEDADGRPVVEAHRPVTRISLQKSGFDANRYVSANVGIGILKQFNITFDYFRRRIIFEKNHFYDVPDVFNRTGLGLGPGSGGWTAATVFPNSPASEAGIEEGDAIIAIDGKTEKQVFPEQVADLFKGPVGSSVPITIERGGKPRTIVIRLRDVL